MVFAEVKLGSHMVFAEVKVGARSSCKVPPPVMTYQIETSVCTPMKHGNAKMADSRTDTGNRYQTCIQEGEKEETRQCNLGCCGGCCGGGS